MPKRAATDEAIDPVRARLAAAAAAPVALSVTKTSAAESDSTKEAAPLQPKAAQSKGPRTSALTVNRKIMVSPDEADRIEETTTAISAAFGSKVTYSQVSRAVWSILAGAEDAIRLGARRAPRLRVPSKGDQIGMAEYEEALADFLMTALKRP